MYTVRELLDDTGGSPYRDWLSRLDVTARARIQARILRFEAGNLGDSKQVGEGVWEARLDIGPGYRVYFAREGREVILLVLGGDKSSQNKDIAQAKKYWAAYKKEHKRGKAK